MINVLVGVLTGAVFVIVIKSLDRRDIHPLSRWQFWVLVAVMAVNRFAP